MRVSVRWLHLGTAPGYMHGLMVCFKSDEQNEVCDDSRSMYRAYEFMISF